MLRLHAISDLHLTHWRGGAAKYYESFAPLDPGEYDVAAVLGDIDNPVMSSIEQIARHHVRGGKPCLYVEGNHDAYRGLDGTRYANTFVEEQHALLREYAPQHGITVLARDTGPAFVGDVRVIGCTGWPEFASELVPSQMTKRDAMFYSQRGYLSAGERMFSGPAPHNDFREIRVGKGNSDHRLTPSQMIAWAKLDNEYLAATLAVPHDGPTVVLTHVGPASALTAGMHSWLYGSRANEDLIVGAEVTLWAHGHTHVNRDYAIGSTRVLSNPRGYPGENPSFDPRLVVEIAAPEPTMTMGM